MGLMDFFKKGREKPVSQPDPRQPGKDAGAPTGSSKPAGPETKTQRDYIIQSGDSLSKIARQVYGNANDWQKIYQANKDTIKDPDKIYPGQKIIIP